MEAHMWKLAFFITFVVLALVIFKPVQVSCQLNDLKAAVHEDESITWTGMCGSVQVTVLETRD